MSVTSKEQTQLGLTGVLDQIAEAQAKVYKAKDGSHFVEIPAHRLRKWNLVLLDAKVAAAGQPGALAALEVAKKTVSELTEAVERRTKEVKALSDKVVSNKARFDEHAEELEDHIDSFKEQLAKSKLLLNETEQAKTATALALKKAQAQLLTPAAKFDPDEAKSLQKEIESLRDDAKLADIHIATERAKTSSLHKQLDVAQKEMAGLRRDLEEANNAVKNFNKMEMAARKGVTELFDLNDVNMEDLLLAFGRNGMSKLQAVLDTAAQDVRGRVGKLIGFFAVITSDGYSRLKALIGLLRKALDVMKTNGTVWLTVVGPWVNVLIKDIVQLKIQTVKAYRLDLEVRMEAVKALPPSASFADRVKASDEAGEERPSWAEVMRDRTSALKTRVSTFLATAKAAAIRYTGAAKTAIWAVTPSQHKVSTAFFWAKVVLWYLPVAIAKDGGIAAKDAASATWAWFKTAFKSRKPTWRPSPNEGSQEPITMTDCGVPNPSVD